MQWKQVLPALIGGDGDSEVRDDGAFVTSTMGAKDHGSKVLFSRFTHILNFWLIVSMSGVTTHNSQVKLQIIIHSKINMSFLTLNILHIAVGVIQLIRLDQAVAPHSWKSVHVPEAALSGHLNGISAGGGDSETPSTGSPVTAALKPAHHWSEGLKCGMTPRGGGGGSQDPELAGVITSGLGTPRIPRRSWGGGHCTGVPPGDAPSDTWTATCLRTPTLIN